MDKETRGVIEGALDRIISEMDTTDMIRWVLREISVHSQEDFALGYLIGFLMRFAIDMGWRRKVVRKSIERTEREMGKERMREIRREIAESSKDYEPFRVYWTKNDMRDMRDILRRRLVDMRRKVSRDFHR